VRDRFAQAVLAGERETEVVVRDRRVGLQAQRFAERALGLRVAAALAAGAPLLEELFDAYGT
jgi:hypothetical protein